MRVAPEPLALFACATLALRVTLALARRLLARVLAIVPRETGADLLEAHVDGVWTCALAFGRVDTADDARIAVALVPEHVNRLPEHERREMLLRALAVSLPSLGRVDAGEPYAMFLVFGVEDGEGVAVGYRDDFADELGGNRGG